MNPTLIPTIICLTYATHALNGLKMNFCKIQSRNVKLNKVPWSCINKMIKRVLIKIFIIKRLDINSICEHLGDSVQREHEHLGDWHHILVCTWSWEFRTIKSGLSQTEKHADTTCKKGETPETCRKMMSCLKLEKGKTCQCYQPKAL